MISSSDLRYISILSTEFHKNLQYKISRKSATVRAESRAGAGSRRWLRRRRYPRSQTAAIHTNIGTLKELLWLSYPRILAPCYQVFGAVRILHYLKYCSRLSLKSSLLPSQYTFTVLMRWKNCFVHQTTDWLGDFAVSPLWTWITTTSCKLSVTDIDVINWTTICPQQNWCVGHQTGCERKIPPCKFPPYAKMNTRHGGYCVNFERFTAVSKLSYSEMWRHL